MADAPTIITSTKSAPDVQRDLRTDTPDAKSKMPGQCAAPGCLSTSIKATFSDDPYLCPVHAK